MSFPIRILILVFLANFISCQPRNLDDSERSNYRRTGHNSDALNFLYIETLAKVAKDYSRIVKDYKEGKEMLEGQIETYNKMIEISYEINKKYSQYIENQVLVEEELAQIQSQLEDLSEALSAAEASDEVKNRLESIKADLESLMDQVFPVEIDWEVVDSNTEDDDSLGLEANEEDPGSGKAGEEAEVEGSVQEAGEEAEVEGSAQEECPKEAEVEGSAQEECPEEESDIDWGVVESAIENTAKPKESSD